MTLNRLASLLFRASVRVRDVQAVRRHRVAQRLVNRAMGRTFGRATRRLWR